MSTMATRLLGLPELLPLSNLGKQLLAETVGTLLLVIVGCGSCAGGGVSSDQANIVRISLTFGLTVATIAMVIGHVSGCHINPAVTFGLTVAGKIGPIKAVLYILAQSTGAILGSSILWAFLAKETPLAPSLRGAAGLGATSVSQELSPGQAFVIETVITMVLVMVVFGAAADEVNSQKVLGSPPLAIGLSITSCHLFAVPLTGASMNPARSLGPAVLLGDFTNLWVYWAGPLTGGLLAALLYQATFRARRLEDSEAK